MAHPWVESVCVFAERDPRLGETPCARVIVKADARNARCADVLRDYCHKRLADYKVPQRIDFVEALPRTASGKILHRNLAADDAHDRNGAEPLGRHA